MQFFSNFTTLVVAPFYPHQQGGGGTVEMFAAEVARTHFSPVPPVPAMTQRKRFCFGESRALCAAILHVAANNP